jgi:putative membrane protein
MTADGEATLEVSRRDRAHAGCFGTRCAWIAWQQPCTGTFAREMNSPRTWLSLIGSGITFLTLHTLRTARVPEAGAPSRFEEALTLVAIGILLIVIADHFRFVFELRHRQPISRSEGVGQGERSYPLPFTLIVALSLLMLGIVAVSSMAYEIGKLG